MVLKITSLGILALMMSLSAWSQQEVEQLPIPVRTFYDTRIVNGHSVETSQEGTGKFIIAHRFGRLNSGAYNLWGLDNSTIRLGFDYGLSNRITLGLGRSSFEKTYDGFAKVKFLQQTEGGNSFPFSLTGLAGVSVRTLDFADPERENQFSNRLYYNYNLLIAKRFGDRLSVQLMPSLLHRNLVETRIEKNDVMAIGGAIRFLASKRITLNAEYYYVPEGQIADDFKNSLSLGFDLETKGHVFQFHFGNSRGMTEKFFITETTGSWEKGDIHFGFNITRDFKVRGRK